MNTKGGKEMFVDNDRHTVTKVKYPRKEGEKSEFLTEDRMKKTTGSSKIETVMRETLAHWKSERNEEIRTMEEMIYHGYQISDKSKELHERRLNRIEEKIQRYSKELKDLVGDQQNSPHKKLKCKRKKRSNAWIKEQVLQILPLRTAEGFAYVSKEDMAFTLEVPVSQVEQVYHELNLMGFLSQAEHHAPHDSQRDPNGFFGVMEWSGDIYRILDRA